MEFFFVCGISKIGPAGTPRSRDKKRPVFEFAQFCKKKTRVKRERDDGRFAPENASESAPPAATYSQTARFGGGDVRVSVVERVFAARRKCVL